MSITIDKTTQRTFNCSVFFALTAVHLDRFDAVNIWATLNSSQRLRFDWGPPGFPLPAGSIVWEVVDRETFGNLTGDHVADAHGIEANCFESAVKDCLNEFARRTAEKR